MIEGHGSTRRIGRYELLELLGRGGMGEVYRARQEKPDREVALKVIRPEQATDELLRRLEFEAEILGRLEHPGIAQVHEAGLHREGSARMPFFAMELVRGQHLLDYADEARLDLRGRLRLFVRICAAVEHAHQKGVIHRDLKPANILVTVEGQPKVLDFGIARVAGDAQVTMMHTTTGQVLGTLQYMSPEQISGDARQLDTRSDVYALGVVLYELLVGELPYDLSGKPIHEIVEVIRERESRRISTVDPHLAGDVETIVGKALEKDKERRYASAAELAEDLRRFLDDEPITARPPDTWYQMRKFARRNRAVVIGASVAAVALVTGTVVSAVMAVRAVRARDDAQEALVSERDARALAQREAERANREQEAAEEVLDFLTEDLLSQASPRAGGREITVLDAVRRAAVRVGDGRFEERPLVEVRVRRAVAETLIDLGDGQAAFEVLEPAREILRRSGELDQPIGLDVQSALGLIQLFRGQPAEAEGLLVVAHDAQLATLGEDHEDTQLTLSNLIELYQETKRFDEAIELAEAALERQRRVWGPDDPRTVLTQGKLAICYQAAREDAAAEPALEGALEAQRRVLGAAAPETLITWGSLAQHHVELGRFAQGLALYEEMLPIERGVLGERHAHVLLHETVVAELYARLDRMEESQVLFDRALAALREAYGADDPATLDALRRYCVLLMRTDRMEEVLELARDLLGHSERRLGVGDPGTLADLALVAFSESMLDRFEDALRSYERLIDARRRTFGEEHPLTLHARFMFADTLWAARRDGEALAAVIEPLEILERSPMPDPMQLEFGISILANVVGVPSDPAERERLSTWLAELRELLAVAQQGD